MAALNNLLAVLLFVAAGVLQATAFTPNSKAAFKQAALTKHNMKFLKDLGFEKPDWLPDFGAGKEEEAPAPAEDEADAEGGAEEAAALEEE